MTQEKSIEHARKKTAAEFSCSTSYLCNLESARLVHVDISSSV